MAYFDETVSLRANLEETGNGCDTNNFDSDYFQPVSNNIRDKTQDEMDIRKTCSVSAPQIIVHHRTCSLCDTFINLLSHYKMSFSWDEKLRSFHRPFLTISCSGSYWFILAATRNKSVSS